MSAYIVLVLAVLSRILPHAFHAVSWNFTAVGGGLLFFGSRMGAGDGSRRFTGAAAARLASAVAVLAAADYYLTVYAYQYPFRVQWYLATWVWYAAVCLLGMGLLNKVTVLRVAGAALASATSFFLISNFAVWAAGTMYPHSLPASSPASRSTATTSLRPPSPRARSLACRCWPQRSSR
jgi:hypothetical protein